MLNPAYMLAVTCAFLTWPGLSFSFRTQLHQPVWTASPALSVAQHPPADAVVKRRTGSGLLTVRIGARRPGGAQLPSDPDANHRSSTSPRATDTVLKDRRRKRPSQPHPHMPPTSVGRRHCAFWARHGGVRPGVRRRHHLLVTRSGRATRLSPLGVPISTSRSMAQYARAVTARSPRKQGPLPGRLRTVTPEAFEEWVGEPRRKPRLPPSSTVWH